MQLYAPQAHLIVVSSLAAREPHLSSYAASKRAGEIAAREVFAGRLTIVRPYVIYGPGDRETLAIFKLAGQTLVPSVGKGTGRIALIHVSDAAAVLAALCDLPVESDKPGARERVVEGKRGSVRVDLGGRRIIKKTIKKNQGEKQLI